MSVFEPISSYIFRLKPLCRSLVQSRVLEQWAANVVVLELPKHPDLHKLRQL